MALENEGYLPRGHRRWVDTIGCSYQGGTLLSLRVTAPELVAAQNVLEEAQSRLQHSPYPEVRRVECRFDSGILTLHGRLNSFYQKQLAQAAVADLGCITQIVNRVRVATWPARETREPYYP